MDPDRQDGLREVVALEGLRSFIADLPVVAVVRQCPRASVLQVLVVNCVLRTMLAVSKRFRRILPDACKSLYVRKAPLAYVLAKEAQNEAGLQHSTTVFFSVLLCFFAFDARPPMARKEWTFSQMLLDFSGKSLYRLRQELFFGGLDLDSPW